MARYDRLAPLPLPPRNACLAGWPALRDLAGRERDAELGRRLRLHFLVLRPISRRVREGDATDLVSLAAQIERVREELGALAARDPQRIVTGQALARLLDPTVETAAGAAVTLGERALEWGHHAAAQEYGELAAELVERSAPALMPRALCLAASAAAAGGRSEEAATLAERAAVAAERHAGLAAWTDAVATAGMVAPTHTGRAAALTRLAEAESRGEAAGDAAVVAAAAEAAARVALHAGAAAAAADHGLRALARATAPKQRTRLLELVGDALLVLGRADGAEHAWALAQATADAADRTRLLARRARCRAESGDASGFRELATQLPHSGVPPAARVELAAASLANGDVEAARRYAQAAHQAARSSLQRDALNAAAALLEQLARSDGHLMAVPVAARQGAPGADKLFERLLAVGASSSRT
jgi:hypothetical protein